MIDAEPEARTMGLPTVRAMLVVFSCGHTGWVKPEHEVGGFVACSACPEIKVERGTEIEQRVPRRVWSVFQLIGTTEVPGIVDWSDEYYR